MKFIIYILFILLFFPHAYRAEGEPKKDTTRANVSNVPSLLLTSGITKQKLVNMVDSLLNLSTISTKSIDLINYYHAILKSPPTGLSMISLPSYKNSINPVTLRPNITKQQLVNMVDSLLNQSTINEQSIELISYYHSMLESPAANFAFANCSPLPAANYYSDFDETLIFQITPECEFPESQVIEIESDSLGSYYHPKQGIVTSKFGWREGRMHKGIDINLNKGDAVAAAFDGMVRIAGVKGGYGNVVIIRHYNGLETVYAHLSKIKVKPGQVVLSGQLIGLGGSTGHSSGPHLHFEVRFKGQAINPASVISFTENKIYNDSIVIKRSGSSICAYPSNATMHTIERGDSWYEVAKHYGLSLKELYSLNGTNTRYVLKVGQQLRIN